MLGDGGGIGGARFLGDWREILVWCSAEVIHRGNGRGWTRGKVEGRSRERRKRRINGQI